MRKFSIVLESDTLFETVNLNGEDGVWFDNPSGLGLSNGFDFADQGGGVFVQASLYNPEQSTIVGDFVFTPNTADSSSDQYEHFYSFVNKLLQATTVTFKYRPTTSMGWNSRRVAVDSLTKTELTSKFLRIGVKLSALEPWHNDDDTYAVALTYSGNNITGTLVAVGSASFPFDLLIGGPLSNPSVVMTDYNGDEIYRCEMNYTFSSGQQFHICTKPGSLALEKLVGTVSTDLKQFCNMTYDPFKLLPIRAQGGMVKITGSTSVKSGDALNLYYYRLVV